jgi:uncharacterized membrane-anchored protein
MKSNYGGSSIRKHSERPKNDFLKLIGTALLIVAATAATAFWAAKHNISRLGMIRILRALICLFVGGFALYVTRKHWSYVSRLPDSAGNRRIKRQQRILLFVGFLFLLGAAWNFLLVALSK